MAQQPCDFEEARLLGQLLDGITAIAQDALVAIDESDCRPARRGVHERRVVTHDPEVFGLDLDLLQVGSANGLIRDRGVVHLAGARVLDLEMISSGRPLGRIGRTRHGRLPEPEKRSPRRRACARWCGLGQLNGSGRRARSGEHVHELKRKHRV
jgi:hypothetical protein